MKINDRLLLGAVAGLGANVVKLAIHKIGKCYKVSELNGPDVAAGMFIPTHNIKTPEGRIVGYCGDAVVAGVLGVCTVLMLSITGKEKAVLKGAITGQIMWQSLYGVLSSMGATKVQMFSPKTAITEFISHTLYGAMAAFIATKLGDEGLFNGKIPLSATPFAKNQGSQNEQFPQELEEHLEGYDLL